MPEKHFMTGFRILYGDDTKEICERLIWYTVKKMERIAYGWKDYIDRGCLSKEELDKISDSMRSIARANSDLLEFLRAKGSVTKEECESGPWSLYYKELDDINSEADMNLYGDVE